MPQFCQYTLKYQNTVAFCSSLGLLELFSKLGKQLSNFSFIFEFESDLFSISIALSYQLERQEIYHFLFINVIISSVCIQ